MQLKMLLLLLLFKKLQGFGEVWPGAKDKDKDIYFLLL